MSTCAVAAGGIVTGRQMAAAVAMGADGVWTGSVWLTTPEQQTSPVVKKMLAASATDTIRSKSRAPASTAGSCGPDWMGRLGSRRTQAVQLAAYAIAVYRVRHCDE